MRKMMSDIRAPFIPQSKINRNPWDEDEDMLWLLTPDELDRVPDGFMLHGIMGDTTVMDEVGPDRDTRFGYVAWGFRESQLP
jgi:hypothetical protein